jgi:hypothetical protein
MRVTAARLILLAAVVITALAWRPVTTWLAADACLDAGGSYDYTLSRCDHEQSHPGSDGSIVLFRNMGIPVVIGVLAVAALIGVFVRQDRRRGAGEARRQ